MTTPTVAKRLRSHKIHQKLSPCSPCCGICSHLTVQRPAGATLLCYHLLIEQSTVVRARQFLIMRTSIGIQILPNKHAQASPSNPRVLSDHIIDQVTTRGRLTYRDQPCRKRVRTSERRVLYFVPLAPSSSLLTPCTFQVLRLLLLLCVITHCSDTVLHLPKREISALRLPRRANIQTTAFASLLNHLSQVNFTPDSTLANLPLVCTRAYTWTLFPIISIIIIISTNWVCTPHCRKPFFALRPQLSTPISP